MLTDGGLSHSAVLWPLLQLIRGGFDSLVNLIFRLFFSKRKPAITLQDPNIKYALRVIDKQVTSQTLLGARVACVYKRSRCVQAPLCCCVFALARCLNATSLWETLVFAASSDCQPWHKEVPLCTAFSWSRPRTPRGSVCALTQTSITTVIMHLNSCW